MDFSKLFSLSYLLDKNPSGDFLEGFPLLIFFIILLSLGSILKNPAKKNKYLKKSLRKKLWPFQILGILGIIFVLARFAQMEALSRPIFIILTTAVSIFFAGFQFFRVRKEYLRRVASAEREKNKGK